MPRKKPAEVAPAAPATVRELITARVDARGGIDPGRREHVIDHLIGFATDAMRAAAVDLMVKAEAVAREAQSERIGAVMSVTFGPDAVRDVRRPDTGRALSYVQSYDRENAAFYVRHDQCEGVEFGRGPGEFAWVPLPKETAAGKQEDPAKLPFY